MKTLCLIGNVWKERLTNTPRNVTLVLANSEDTDKANALYSRHVVANSEVISVEIFLPSETGIINCRVNGEHKQVRFQNVSEY